MKRTVKDSLRVAALIAAAFILATSAHAGADINLLFKGSPASADVPSLAASRDFIVFGDGTGPSKLKAARAANPTVPIAVYVKAGGVRQSDAEWLDAQPLLWKSATGGTYTQTDNSWAFGDLQRYPNQWAAAVVIPHLKAALDALPAGTVDWIMVDNAIYQDSSLFKPTAPPDYDVASYHDGTVAVLRAVRSAFPSMKLIANGWQGGSKPGYRGEILGTDVVDGVWVECWYRKCSGKVPDVARFQQDQGAVIALLNAGKVVVVDEAGIAPFTPMWREAFGVWLSTTARASTWERAFFSLGGPPWGDWQR